MTFRVWAPAARRVELEIHGAATDLDRAAGGWWIAEVPTAEAEVDYRYRLDDGDWLPDPRSPWQPDGPFGASRTVNHAEFRWSDLQWQARPLSSAVIYELHVGTFTPEGTFLAILDKLEHLRELGVTHVELMPVAEFPGQRGWGYDGVDLYSPHHHYGTPTDLKRLVDGCHRAGLAVILDVVYNHLGPSGNFLPRFGPYFTERHHTDWGSAVNFDGAESDEVRRFFCDNALMWLRDYHFDALRLDAVHAILDTAAIPFLEQLATEVRNLEAHLGRHFSLIAESDLNDPRLVRSRDAGGFGLDGQWSDDFHHALHAALTGEQAGYYGDFGSLDQLATALKEPYVYSGCHSRFRQRCHGRPAQGLSAHRFVACLQNHDQVGNRARGDRIGHLVNPDRAKLGAALTILAPYVPLLFQGEEWNASSPFQYFVDFAAEPELARAVSVGRRNEFRHFGWKPEDVPDPQDPHTFRRSKLDWKEVPAPAHGSMLDWYRQLIGLRRTLADLTDGRPESIEAWADPESGLLTVVRGAVTLVASFSSEERPFTIPDGQPGHVYLHSKAAFRAQADRWMIPAESLAVFGPAPPAGSAQVESLELATAGREMP
jgi:maltooligosyltrehalose trehalohydrolase